jgi:hypothetical protein
MKRLIMAAFLLAQSALGTVLVNETFEGTGTPSGWSGTGSADFDYTTSPLAGSQSLRCPASSAGIYNSGGVLSNTELWGQILYRIDSMPTSAEIILDMRQAFVAFAIDIYLATDGTLIVNDGASTFVQTVSGMSVGTIYNIWWHYKKGTGANSVIETSWDVAGNPRPNSGNKFASSSTAGGTATVDQAGFGWSTGGGTDAVSIIDNVQIADTDAFAGGGPTPTATPTAAPSSSPSNRFFLFPQ